MSGILYVVATPIGNLEDVTLRALRILREVSVIAAEDTRRTAKLLQHYSISTPTTSLHAHNEHARTPYLIDRLRSGDSIAVVSDAGTPGISDPGSRLVSAAHAAGLTVVPIPGASAVSAVISAAGVGDEGFVFAGFAPSRSGDRKRWLEDIWTENRPVVFYESPHRIHDLLADLNDLGPERRLGIGRELTKVHESLVIRPISQWIDALPPAQGEFTLILHPGEVKRFMVSDQQLAAEFFAASPETGESRRDVIRRIAGKFGVNPRRVYAAVELLSNSGE